MSKEIVATLALSTLLVVVWLSWPESPPACADAEWQTLLRWRTLHKNNSLLLGRCHVDTYEHAMAIALKVGDQETFFCHPHWLQVWRGAVVRRPKVLVCFRIASQWRSLIDVFVLDGLPPPADASCQPQPVF